MIIDEESTASYVLHVAVSHDGTRVAVCRGDHRVHIHSCATGRVVSILSYHPRSPVACHFHPLRSDVLVSVCRAGTFVAWRLLGEGRRGSAVASAGAVHGDSGGFGFEILGTFVPAGAVEQQVVPCLSLDPETGCALLSCGDELYEWDDFLDRVDARAVPQRPIPTGRGRRLAVMPSMVISLQALPGGSAAIGLASTGGALSRCRLADLWWTPRWPGRPEPEPRAVLIPMGSPSRGPPTGLSGGNPAAPTMSQGSIMSESPRGGGGGGGWQGGTQPLSSPLTATQVLESTQVLEGTEPAGDHPAVGFGTGAFVFPPEAVSIARVAASTSECAAFSADGRRCACVVMTPAGSELVVLSRGAPAGPPVARNDRNTRHGASRPPLMGGLVPPPGASSGARNDSNNNNGARFPWRPMAPVPGGGPRRSGIGNLNNDDIDNDDDGDGDGDGDGDIFRLPGGDDDAAMPSFARLARRLATTGTFSRVRTRVERDGHAAAGREGQPLRRRQLQMPSSDDSMTAGSSMGTSSTGGLCGLVDDDDDIGDGVDGDNNVGGKRQRASGVDDDQPRPTLRAAPSFLLIDGAIQRCPSRNGDVLSSTALGQSNPAPSTGLNAAANGSGNAFAAGGPPPLDASVDAAGGTLGEPPGAPVHRRLPASRKRMRMRATRRPKADSLDVPGWTVVARTHCPVPWLVSTVRLTATGHSVLVTFGGEWRQASFLGSLEPSRAYPIVRVFSVLSSSRRHATGSNSNSSSNNNNNNSNDNLDTGNTMNKDDDDRDDAMSRGVNRRLHGRGGSAWPPLGLPSSSPSSAFPPARSPGSFSVGSTLRPPPFIAADDLESAQSSPPCDLVCVRELRSPIEAVNAATFAGVPGTGVVYGTLSGKVVQLTLGQREWTPSTAAVKIQSVFRGWSLRRARSAAEIEALLRM